MTMSKFLRTCAAVTVLANAVAGPATAQLLPGLPSTPLDRAIDDQVLRDVERRVEDQVQSTRDQTGELVERVQEAFDDIAGEVTDIAKLPGIVSAPEGRPVDLDTVDGWLVIRDEWVLIADVAQLPAIAALGLDVLEEDPLANGTERLLIVSFRGDEARLRDVQQRLGALGIETLDRNHVYLSSAPLPASAIAMSAKGASSVSGQSLPVGLIDTDIDETHPAFKGFSLMETDFVAQGALRPQAHGTAVASLLAQNLPASTAKDVPSLRAASVFFLASDGTTGATSASLVRAIDWMLAQDVRVINFSLSGPPNAALEKMIARSRKAGVVIVAAVGNDGPAARPLYPAAYDGVIGVTAVDADGKVYRWANRGDYVDVAARGVSVEVAKAGGGSTLDSGTSLAAPRVTAWLARSLSRAGADADAMSLIQQSARPTSKAGRDTLTGYGILSADPSS